MYANNAEFANACRTSYNRNQLIEVNSRSWFFRIAYYCKDDYDSAVSDFTEALRLDPDFADAYYNRGNAYLLIGDYDKTISDCNEAIRLKPDFANPYRHRGFAYMQKGDYRQARVDCDKSLQLNLNYQRAKDLDAELKEKGY